MVWSSTKTISEADVTKIREAGKMYRDKMAGVGVQNENTMAEDGHLGDTKIGKVTGVGSIFRGKHAIRKRDEVERSALICIAA